MDCITPHSLRKITHTKSPNNVQKLVPGSGEWHAVPYRKRNDQDVMFHNTLEIIPTNPNCPQHYGTQHNDFNSKSTSCPTPTKPQAHVSHFSSTLPSHLTCSSDSLDNLSNPGPNADCTPGHCPCLDTTPTWCPGYLSPYQHSGSKPNLSPHHNPDSVPHVVVVPRC